MKYIKVDYIICCNNAFEIIVNGGIVFDKQIIDFGTYDDMQKKHKKKFEYLGKGSILMPAFINPHTHLEFCNHTNAFEFGNFTLWLKSVILSKAPKATKEQISQELNDMLSYGVGSIGAISSFGLDIDECAKSKINVVLFNEILGSKQEMFKNIKQDFTNRLNKSIELSKNNDSFIPAISIHSPYSTAKKLASYAIKKANKYNLSISSHFLESTDESEYINKNKGAMREFFENILGKSKRNYKSSFEFLSLFDLFDGIHKENKNKTHTKQNKRGKNTTPTLSFVHCNLATKKHIKKINSLNASIIHCPKSNTLLGSPLLKIYKKTFDKSNISIATDGLSSNNSSHIIDELKSALFLHSNYNKKNIYTIANNLLLSATKNASITLGLKKGIIKKNYDSDFIMINLNKNYKQKQEYIALDLILNTQKENIKYMYLNGDRVK